MKIQIKRIAPVQAGKISAALYGLLSLIIVPFVILASAFTPKGGHFPIYLALVFPVIYAGLGFLLGVLCAFIYNVVANWFGGIEISYEEAA
jgi:hypothetical protein